MDASQCDLNQIRSLLQELNKVVDGSTTLNESSRASALHAAKELTTALERPDVAVHEFWLSPNTVACVMIALDLGIFTTIAEDDSQFKTAKDLAKPSGAEPLLVVRIMRVLTAMGFAKEAGTSLYGSNPKTKAMAKPSFAVAMAHQVNVNVTATMKAPEYFRLKGYKSPTDSSQTPFQFAYDTDSSFYEWMQQRPALSANFNKFMQGIRMGAKHWTDWFPVQETLLDAAKDDAGAPLMVDVGGGRGQDLVSFHKAFPKAPGKLILQDLQHVVDEVDNPDFEKMTHDFFTPQPVRGARVYFLHYNLHNWDDEKCISILQNIASAMTPGYSKILINEWILPDTGASLQEASLDMQMMMAFGGMERGESQWKELLERAGLKCQKFWHSPGFGIGIVEATL